ncbi:MAG: hypothetical protein PVF65_12685 [Sphingomonadales bacterium]|jgi:hypothetical protein
MIEIIETYPLTDEPDSDRAYRLSSGNLYRVRTRPRDVESHVELSAAEHVAVPSGFGVEISVSVLDEDFKVKSDAQGRYQVMQSEVHTVDHEALQKPDFDIEQYLSDCLYKQLASAETWVTQMDSTNDIFNRWMSGDETALRTPTQEQEPSQ